MKSAIKTVMAASLGFVMITASNAYAAAGDETDWLRCETNADCAVVALGCRYWQPVNGRHLDDMKAKYETSCLASVPSGPKPEVKCTNNICTNNYTVKYWKALEEAPGKNAWIGRKIDECLKNANININWDGISKTSNVSKMYDYIALRAPFLQKVNGAINQGTYDDEEDLQHVIDATISCEEVARSAEQYKD
jgi:hypothetical protein